MVSIRIRSGAYLAARVRRGLVERSWRRGLGHGQGNWWGWGSVV